jgi:hypothetical protein
VAREDTQFKPKTSGNPGGRPKGVERRFREVVESRVYVAKDGTEHTGLDALANVLLDIAYDQKEQAKDRRAAVADFTDRGYGKVKDTVVIEGAEQRPVNWRAVPESDREDMLSAVQKLLAYTEPAADTEH